MSRRGPLLRFDDDDDDDPPPIPPYSLRCVKPPLSLHLLKSSPAISIKRPKSQVGIHTYSYVYSVFYQIKRLYIMQNLTS